MNNIDNKGIQFQYKWIIENNKDVNRFIIAIKFDFNVLKNGYYYDVNSYRWF